MADLSKHPLLFLTAAALILLGGCELFGGLVGEGGAPDVVEVLNETDQRLYVDAYDQETLSLIDLAPEIEVRPGNSNLIASGERLEIPTEEIGDGFGRGDVVVFVVYEPAGGDRYRLSAMIDKSYDELRSHGFRVVIQPEDLAHEDLFGDQYFVVTDEENAGRNMHPPVIEDGTLNLWVAFGGCDEGTFTLSEWVHEERSQLAVVHDYPDHEVDCDRLNYEELRFELSAEVLAQDRIVLLNPNRGADPYAHAFILRGDAEAQEIDFEIHLNNNFDDDRVRVEVDGHEVFDGRVTTDYIWSLAEVIKVDASSGRHRINVEVNNAYSASKTFYLDRPLYVQVRFYSAAAPQHNITEGIQIEVSETPPMYD